MKVAGSGFMDKLAVLVGLGCFAFVIGALAYSGSDDFGLDFVLTKIESLLGGAGGVLLAIFLVAIGVVMIMRAAFLPGIITIVCTFVLMGIVGIAKKVSGLIL
ncbi:MAG: hypothetical protein LBF86_08620 [Helicobacteraceae bacterium]|jgi:hypothetical protein|nr:hypothetical protein [Helicobacteraceae bacterium]